MSEQSPKPDIQQDTVEQSGRNPRIKQLQRITAVAGLVAVTLGVGYAAGAGNGEDGPSNQAAAAEQIDDNGDAANGVATSSSEGLARGKFLPESSDGQINSDDEATSYTKSFFNDNGPLANEINAASLSAIDAVVVEPATSKGVDSSASMQVQFENDMISLVTQANAEVADDLSDTARAILNTDGRYDELAIANADKYTEVLPVYNEAGDIVEMKFVHKVAKQDHPALVYKARGEESVTVDDEEVPVSGYGDVILIGDGSIWIKGHIPLPKSGKDKGPEKAPHGKDKGEEKAPSGNGPNKEDVCTDCGKDVCTGCPGPAVGPVPTPQQPIPQPEQPQPQQPQPEQPQPQQPQPEQPQPEQPEPEEPTPEPGKPVDPGLRSSSQTSKGNVTYSY